MKVGVFVVYSGDPVYYVLGDIMLRSIRKSMPGIDIVHFTDEHSPQIPGTNSIIRKTNNHLIRLWLEHFSSCEGEWLLIDCDTIIQKNVQHVFSSTFDIAISTREGTLQPEEEKLKLYKHMPYNAGVVFSRCQPFWQECLKEFDNMSAKTQKWYGIQQAVCNVIKSNKFNAKIISNTYNFPPTSGGSNQVKDYHIVHYKGPTRKQFMIDRISEYT